MDLSPQETVVLCGLAIGVVFGAIGQASGYCVMSALRGWWGTGDSRKVRTVALATAVAIAGSQTLDAAGLVTLRNGIYILPSFALPVMAVGGILFGYGMIMANGCGARALVLLSRGNLRSLVVLLALAVSAQATLTGVLALPRLDLSAATTVNVSAATAPGVLAGWGVSADLARWLVTAVLAGGLAIFAFLHGGFRRSPLQIAAGLIVGLTIVAGWYATGNLGADDFDPVPVESLTYVAPISASVRYLMLSTGMALTFGIAAVGGTLLGGFAYALASRGFHLEGFTSPRLMLRYIGGGVFMGVGGALALGCTIGQGLTGLSTLAVASFVSVFGILAGAALGIRGPLRLAPPAT